MRDGFPRRHSLGNPILMSSAAIAAIRFSALEIRAAISASILELGSAFPPS